MQNIENNIKLEKGGKLKKELNASIHANYSLEYYNLTTFM